jgi:hypothetical protein
LIETVVDEQDVKRRVVIVKHWIEVGEECLKMNNFDTLMAITNGIESTPVSRLYNTWEVCPLLIFFVCSLSRCIVCL